MRLLFLCDDGVIKRINAALLHTLGYQRDEVIGHSIEPLLNTNTRTFYRTSWR